MKMASRADEYRLKSNKRLIPNKITYINAKALAIGVTTETISEFDSPIEAREALPALKQLYPDHIVFASDVCTSAWNVLDDETKNAVRDIIAGGAE